MATNFQNITESPEKLADFLFECVSCNHCQARNYCELVDETCVETLEEWLQEETNG